MMTPSSFAPAVISAPGGVAAEPESSTPASSGEDFSSFMQACHSRSGKAAQDDHTKYTKPVSSQASPQSDATPDATSPNADATKTTSAKSDPASGSTDDAKDQSAAANATTKTSDVDPSVTSTIMAMLMLPIVPPIETKVVIPVATAAAKIAVNDKASGTPVGIKPTSQTPSTTTGQSLDKVVAPKVPTDAAAKVADAQKATAEKGSVFPEADQTTPADIAALKATPIAANATIPQQVVADISSTLLKGVASPIPSDGTGVALSKERMKFTAQKNEIAGSTVQKMQGASRSDVSTDADSPDAVLGLSTSVSERKKDDLTPTLDLNFSAKTPAGSLQTPALVEISKPVDAASQADRVAQLVSREVLSLRQTGAESIAVSLKVDAHTDISLQLSTHEGQIQAAVRCERGSLAGLDGHWNDLQSSLAKQNITLLPLEATSRSTGSNLSNNSGGSANFNFNQSSQQQQQSPARQIRDFAQDLTSAAVGKTVRNPQPKTQVVSGKGWESWA